MKDFSGFLDNAETYELAVSYWSDLCNKLLSDIDCLSLWDEWLNVRFSDGTPFMDGNPIYSLVNRSRKLALKIIQVDIDQEGVVFDIWENETEIEGGSYKMLVIYCSLNSETELNISRALKSWFEL